MEVYFWCFGAPDRLHTVRVETIYHEQATVEDRVWTTHSQTLYWLNGMTKKRYDIWLVNTTLLYSAQLFIRGKNKVLCNGLFFVRISKLKSLWLQNYVAQIHPSHYVKQSSPGIFLASAVPWQMTRWARFTIIAWTPSFFLFLFLLTRQASPTWERCTCFHRKK